jgi:hypothetical protein
LGGKLAMTSHGVRGTELLRDGRRKSEGRAAAVLVAAVTLCAGHAIAASFEMDKIETPTLRLLYFDPTETYLTPHIQRSFQNSLQFQQRILNWWPWEKTTVLLKDFTDYGNASARSSPNNAVVIDIAPTRRAFETFTSAERMYTYMNHELVHVSTTDVWNKADGAWRDFFHGKPTPVQEHPESILYNYLTTPRLSAPRWYLEGSAVFLETWMGGGIGRAQGAYDEMVFRAMVRDDAYFYDPLGLASEGQQVDFQLMANAYLYGTRFMSYLALTYSPEKVLEWLKRGEDSRRYYSVQFEKVFGRSLNVAWHDWIRWEHEFQRANLASVEQYPPTMARPLAREALGSISRSYINPHTGDLIGAFRYPGVLAHIGEMSMKTGKIKRLTNVKGAMLYRVTALAYDPKTNTAWYTADNNAFRDLMEVGIASGKTRMLIRDARIGELVFRAQDRSLWGVRHLNGLATLVTIPHPYQSWNQVHTWRYGETLYDIDISPDGELLSGSLDHINGRGSLEVFRIQDLKIGAAQPIASFDFGQATPEGFVFSPDGRFLYGSSYYTGVSNIYRFEIATKKIEAVSNAVTGFFRPLAREDGSLIVYEYTGDGFMPGVIDPRPLQDLGAVKFLGAEVAKARPVVKSWAVGSPSKVNLDTIVTRKGKYRPWRELQLGSAYPVVEGYKNAFALGWNFNIEDPMQFARLRAAASYSPDDTLRASERLHATLDYQGINWHARYRHNGADFYDLFGPTKRSRKGDSLLAGYRRVLIYDPPRELTFTAESAYYTGLDTLPGNQNVQSGAEEIATADFALHYQYMEESIGGVDHEKGVAWDFNTGADHANRIGFPKFRAGFDFGFPLPWKHSSIWAYNSGGIAGGPRTNSLASFYFGGFGNNYVDNGEVKRYRQYASFPGFDIDEISARRFAKTVVEWNLPPVRFRNAGIPSLYLAWARPALFVGTLWTDPGGNAERTSNNAGFQLDFSFTLAHRLPMMLSFGHAIGFVSGDKRGEETMLSLKIL